MPLKWAYQVWQWMTSALPSRSVSYTHLLAFAGKSLENPRPNDWRVKKDGGAFDQFTGATITPRAVVKATRKFLEYVQMHREQWFAPTATAKGQQS